MKDNVAVELWREEALQQEDDNDDNGIDDEGNDSDEEVEFSRGTSCLLGPRLLSQIQSSKARYTLEGLHTRACAIRKL